MLGFFYYLNLPCYWRAVSLSWRFWPSTALNLVGLPWEFPAKITIKYKIKTLTINHLNHKTIKRRNNLLTVCAILPLAMAFCKAFACCTASSTFDWYIAWRRRLLKENNLWSFAMRKTNVIANLVFFYLHWIAISKTWYSIADFNGA